VNANRQEQKGEKKDAARMSGVNKGPTLERSRFDQDHKKNGDWKDRGDVRSVGIQRTAEEERVSQKKANVKHRGRRTTKKRLTREETNQTASKGKNLGESSSEQKNRVKCLPGRKKKKPGEKRPKKMLAGKEKKKKAKTERTRR